MVADVYVGGLGGLLILILIILAIVWLVKHL